LIAVDSSALMAVVLGEAEADACIAIMEVEPGLVISAATLAEVLIVAHRRNVAQEIVGLVEGLDITVQPVTEAGARRVAAAYARWGKGVHPAGLNFGDCFAYALAKENDCPLLYVGCDFEQTDVIAAG